MRQKCCERTFFMSAIFAARRAWSVVELKARCEQVETGIQRGEKMFQLTSVGNARELGGYKTNDGRSVKQGVLLRTAGLNAMSEEDKDLLTSVYHLDTIVDLRMEKEIEKAPDPQIENVRYVKIAILDGEASFPEELQKEYTALKMRHGSWFEEIGLLIRHGFFSDQLYVVFLSSELGKRGYSQFFRELLALPEGKSILFHCTQGKDRTGCAAMLILFALGVDEETILHDYCLTNEYNAELIVKERRMLEASGVEDVETFLCVMDQVNPAFMKNCIDWMKKQYGSPLGYIEEALGVTKEEIAMLREKFLS